MHNRFHLPSTFHMNVLKHLEKVKGEEGYLFSFIFFSLYGELQARGW